MSDFKKYFEEELRILAEEGKEFGESFPELAGYLNLSSVDDRDPYVERLIESFAYLTGRIRQKMDDEFPEISGNILEIIAPDFLRPVPSLSLVQFMQRPGMLQSSLLLARGTEVLSNPVGDSLTVCRFQTTQDVMMHPLELSEVSVISHPAKGDGVKFEFSAAEGADLSKLSGTRLPVYLSGDRSLVWEMHYLLTEKVKEISYCLDDGAEKIYEKTGPLISAGGFTETQALLPESKNSLDCGRFLKEFFIFEEKFRFIELPEMSFLRKNSEYEKISLTVYLDQVLDPGKKLSTENFRLFVSPIVNLFEHQSEPVRLDHKHFEYQVTPSLNHKLDVYKVNSVTGIDKVSGRRHEYLPFNEFRHPANHKAGENGNYFSVRRENSPAGVPKIFISPGTHGNVEEYREEYLSLSLSCTNSSIPRNHIFEKDICCPVSGFPEVIYFNNISRPAVPVYPPERQQYLWNVLSHLNMNFKTITRIEVFREVLSLYDWKNSGNNRKIINGIIEVEGRKKSHMLNGQLIHGTDITVKFRDGVFRGDGEKNIFGRVLLQFLTHYTSINYVVSLNFIFEPSGKKLSWAPVMGNSIPI